MIDPLDVHLRAENIGLPGDVTTTAEHSVVAWTLAGADGVRQLLLQDLSATTTETAGPELPDNLDVAMLRWAGSDLLLAAVVGGAGEHTDLVGIDVDLTLKPPTASIAWRHRLPGAIEDIRPGREAHLVLVAEPGSERDGSHLGTRVGPIGDPVVDRTDSARRCLVHVAANGQQRVLDADGANVWSVDWDGRSTAVAVVSDDPRQAGFYTPRLVRIDVHDDSVTDLYSTSWQLAQPRLSPDGRAALAVEGLSIVSGRVVEVDLDTQTATHWDDVDDVTDLGWLDDQRVWIAGWDGTGSFVAVADRAGVIRSRWAGPVSLRGRDGQPSVAPTTDGGFVTVADCAGHGPELAALRLDTAGLNLLTGVNDAARDLTDGVERSTVSWQSGDGLTIEGLLLRPAATDGTCPLVVVAHGGPTWLWSEALSPAESYNVVLPLVHAGAAVLLPNPRGSSGYGQEFARGVIGDVGGRDLDDVLTGIAAMVDREAADADRVGMLGLSYGGYLTAMAVTAAASPVRAAVVLSGVTDWLSFRTTSNLGGTYDELYHRGIGPTNDAGRNALATVSPVYRATADAPPTLVLHSRDDRTTPIGQGEMFHRALLQAGATSQLVTYPDEGHELVVPDHRRDAFERTMAWLTAHGVLM